MEVTPELRFKAVSSAERESELLQRVGVGVLSLLSAVGTGVAQQCHTSVGPLDPNPSLRPLLEMDGWALTLI